MGSGGRGRRFWSPAEKRRIVAESYEEGVSVSAVARRHDVNANLLFTWRRDPRLGGRLASPVLLPVEVCADGDQDNGSIPHDGDDLFEPLPAGTEVTACGVRIRFTEPVSVTAAVQLMTALRDAA